jgi:hypothetical protein
VVSARNLPGWLASDRPGGYCHQTVAERKQSETAKRQEKRRQEKLDAVKQQVEEGSLTIRKMTPEERKKYPPQDRPKKKR